MSYTLEDIYFSSPAQLRKWLGRKYTDGGLYDRLSATIVFYNQERTAPQDDFYIIDPQFNIYYLQSDAELDAQIQRINPLLHYVRSFELGSSPIQMNIDLGLDLSNFNHLDRIRWLIDANQKLDQSRRERCQSLAGEYVDQTGQEIFDVFVKKYSANNIFGRARDRVKFLYQTKVLLTIDRDRLNGIIREFETLYDQFIDRVHAERQFYEKSGAGKGPREIITAQDWAEAIIELQDTANKFEQILNDQIQNYTKESHLETGCQKTSFSACSYPCSPVKNIIRAGGKCIYKR